jgi:hypothetical protein
MGNVSFGAPRALVTRLQAQFDLEAFVETGTFRGDTTVWAAGVFPRVHTVEAQPEIFRQTALRLAAFPNVQPRNTDTRTFLHELIPQLTRPALFWLDAHWCGSPQTHGAADECPLMGELREIAASPISHFVLVDDARLFLAPPAAPHDPSAWPSLRELMQGPCFGESRYYSLVRNDNFIAVPAAQRAWLIDDTRAEDLERQTDGLLTDGLTMTRTGLQKTWWGARRTLKRMLVGDAKK